MEEQATRRINSTLWIFVVVLYGLAVITQTQAQYTACTTRGNHTSHIYREVAIKNARTSVTISSPNFPQPYPQNIQCTWRILAPPGYQVKLSFLTFELEQSHLISGCHDYVSVREGGKEFKEAREIRKRCGSSKPPVVRSERQVLWVRFVTDTATEKEGFSIKVIPASESSSNRYIALGILVTVLLIIIVAIILCRKYFQRKQQEEEPVKVRRYQELPVPSDTDQPQTDPPNDDPEEREEGPSSPECKSPGRDKSSGVFHLRTLRSSEASGYCSLSEDGGSVENESHRSSSSKGTQKKSPNEQGDLEYTELLTVL